jgi:hypothetical protein
VSRLLLILALLAQDPAVKPEDPESPVHPRKFGQPGGIGVSRGWYVWHGWNPRTGQAEISSESSGEKFTARVLPWATTYRHLAYGAHPDDLLPGERVNMFFNPEGAVKRAYLVHFQDEIGQMKGHGHAWQVEEVAAGGRGFSARVMHGDQPFEKFEGTFQLDAACRIWRDGKTGTEPGLAKGEKLYLTWCYEGARRVVKMLSDGASVAAIEADARRKVQERVAREGMGAFLESVEDGKAKLLVFSTHWAQAAAIKPGQTLTLQAAAAGGGVDVQVVSRKNLGAYGSGPNEILLENATAALQSWTGGNVIRVFIRE